MSDRLILLERRLHTDKYHFAVVMFLPRALSSLADAQTAVQRLGEFFQADISVHKINIDPQLEVAIKVENATFEWVAGEETLAAKKNSSRKKEKLEDSPMPSRRDSSTKPFRLENVNFVVSKGQLVAIIGPVSPETGYLRRFSYSSRVSQTRSEAESRLFSAPWLAK